MERRRNATITSAMTVDPITQIQLLPRMKKTATPRLIIDESAMLICPIVAAMMKNEIAGA